eukprot:898724_1
MIVSALCESIERNDLVNVKNIGMTSGFPDNNTTRIRCYSMLLGCGELDAYDQAGKNILIQNTQSIVNNDQSNIYTDQIHRDLTRNGYSNWNKTSKFSRMQ